MKDYEMYREWKGWSGDDFGRCTKEQLLYFSVELEASGFSKFNGTRVLEIGFGNGSFAAFAESNGAYWTGVEVIPQLVDESRLRGWSAYDMKDFESLKLEKPYDLVVAFDVFEHLDIVGLCNLLLRCRELLADDGRLIGRVPSGDSPYSGATQNGDITHRCTLGSSAVKQIAYQCGYQVLQIREPAFPVRGLGVISMIRRLHVKLARKAIFPIIRRVLMGGSSAVLTPNMVFVLRNAK